MTKACNLSGDKCNLVKKGSNCLQEGEVKLVAIGACDKQWQLWEFVQSVSSIVIIKGKQQDPKDSHIPHHIKFWQLTIDMWNEYLTAIKLNLAIGHFILDNASNNKTVMDELSQLLQKDEIGFDVVDHQIPSGPYTFKKVEYIKALQNQIIDWARNIDLKVILEAPHHTQQCMSSKTSPLLGSTIPAFEELIQRWNLVADLVPHCAPLVGIGLTWAAKYNSRMSLTGAYAIAMFIDPTRHLSWMNEHWTILQITEAKNYILKLVYPPDNNISILKGYG
ncbi:hypothetical protein BD769DRAFT_1388149 [Suillus cothurnatus]|nr:hypothetical protein BD769DRAFT_1388149 [Suillus cothurnatus]